MKYKGVILGAFALFLAGCASAPRFDAAQVRPWKTGLDSEYLSKKPYIAVHEKGPYQLFYLAAHHENDPKSKTLQLVDKLFLHHQFDALILEPFPYSAGESPAWFVKEARSGIKKDIVIGGESAWAAIKADDKKISFYGGEPDHQEIYRILISQGYEPIDVIGFYFVRQIPQWVREKEEKKDVIAKRGPPYLQNYCKTFGISSDSCPTVFDLKKWYADKTSRTLNADVSTEDVAPLSDSHLFLHQISSAIGAVRDRFTLDLIQRLLGKYRRIAVIYGSSHYVTLRNSIDAAMGPPRRVEAVQ